MDMFTNVLPSAEEDVCRINARDGVLLSKISAAVFQQLCSAYPPMMSDVQTISPQHCSFHYFQLTGHVGADQQSLSTGSASVPHSTGPDLTRRYWVDDTSTTDVMACPARCTSASRGCASSCWFRRSQREELIASHG
jgi:hypothetical protein